MLKAERCEPEEGRHGVVAPAADGEPAAPICAASQHSLRVVEARRRPLSGLRPAVRLHLVRVRVGVGVGVGVRVRVRVRVRARARVRVRVRVRR